jgi:peptide/nickel transport system substrate-binding protein
MARRRLSTKSCCCRSRIRRRSALRSGQVDIITGIDPSIASEVEEDHALKLYNSATGRMYPIQMRTDVAPFSDVRLRQALRLVLDRDAVVASVWNGYATVGSDLYGRYDPNYNKALIRKRDVAKAKALIQEAGLTGKSLELVMAPKDVGTALVLADNAKEIGITIKVTKLDDATFYNADYLQRPFFGGDFYPAGPFFLTSSLVDAPNAGLDQVRWRDKEYLDLWNESARTTDPERLHKRMDKLQEILFDRGAWIVAGFPNELAAYRPNVVGLPTFDYTGTGVFRAFGVIGVRA